MEGITRIKMLVFLLILICGILHAGDEDSLSAPPPDIRFEEGVFDFGIVLKGEKVTHIFKFKNEGEGLLRIEKVRSTCGCTTADLKSKEILPGGEGEIEVRFSSGAYNGQITKRVYVHSNDPDEGIVALEIKGRVKSDVRVIPSRLYLGEIEKGEGGTWKFKVIPVDIEKLNIIKLETDCRYISLKKAKYNEGDKTGYEITLVLSPQVPEGDFYGVISIHTNSDLQPVINVEVSGKVLGEIDVIPKEIDFDISRDDSLVLSITLEQRGRRGVYINGAKDELGYFTAALFLLVHKGQLGEGVVYRLKLKPTPTAPSGQIRETLKIYTNDENQPELDIILDGIIH